MNRYKLFRNIAVSLLVAMTMTLIASAQNTENLQQVKFKINITNSAAKNKIETITNAFKGVSESEYVVADKTLNVKFNPEEINTEMLMHLLKVVGYDSEIAQEKKSDKDGDKTKELGKK